MARDFLTQEASRELREILSRCVIGAAEALSLIVAVASHGALDWGATRVLHDMPAFLFFTRSIFALGFVVVYCQLVANFVAAFVPRLKWLKGGTGGSYEAKRSAGSEREA